MKSLIGFAVVALSAGFCFAEAPFSLGPTKLRDADTLSATTEPVEPPVNVSSGLVEYMATRFEAHEPIYFLYWPDSPDVKFQYSLKYRLVGPRNKILNYFTPDGSSLYLAFTQMTLWNISGESAPIYDTSYKPEVMYQYEQEKPTWLAGLSHFDLQVAYQHESNGKGVGDSRSMNILYVRPIFTFGDAGNHANPKNDWFITVAPRVWAYLNDTEPQGLKDYRGYGDLRITLGERGGVQLSVLGRIGEGLKHPAMECDLSCPLSRVGIRNPDFYVLLQYWLGPGESLLEYDRSGSSVRVGLALVR